MKGKMMWSVAALGLKRTKHKIFLYGDMTVGRWGSLEYHYHTDVRGNKVERIKMNDTEPVSAVKPTSALVQRKAHQGGCRFLQIIATALRI